MAWLAGVSDLDLYGVMSSEVDDDVFVVVMLFELVYTLYFCAYLPFVFCIYT